VDWEIYSSLRSSASSSINGLIAIELPSVAGSARLQARVDDNVERDSDGKDLGYARWYAYPTHQSSIRNWVEDAYRARVSRSYLIDNTRKRRRSSAQC